MGPVEVDTLEGGLAMTSTETAISVHVRNMLKKNMRQLRVMRVQYKRTRAPICVEGE